MNGTSIIQFLIFCNFVSGKLRWIKLLISPFSSPKFLPFNEMSKTMIFIPLLPQIVSNLFLFQESQMFLNIRYKIYILMLVEKILFSAWYSLISFDQVQCVDLSFQSSIYIEKGSSSKNYNKFRFHFEYCN